MLDPFRPERAEDLLLLRELQASIYDSFKAHVRARRGARLKGEDAVLFDGRIWAGPAAVELGLADGVGEAYSVVREQFGSDAKLVPMSRSRPLVQRWLGMSADQVVAGIGAAIEERALWARYGL